MKRYLYLALSAFVLVGIGSCAARTLGLYHAHWYTDVLLHLVAGVGFGFIWLGLMKKWDYKKPLVLILGASALAVLGSVLWEVWEFAGWRLIPGHMRNYIPELGDSLSDILWGLIGGAAAGFWRARK